MVRQEYILNYFKKSIEKNKISHAYLFQGPKGSGKEQILFWFIKLLQCQNKRSIKNCSCLSCKDIDANRHPDIKIVQPLEGKREIGIDQIRELKNFLSLSWVRGPFKIAIINPAEALSLEAANALLKTLEEPSKDSIIFLISNTPSLLPQTIISRCQIINFPPTPLDEISDTLVKNYYIDILSMPFYKASQNIEQIIKNEKEVLSLLESWIIWLRNSLVQKEDNKTASKKLKKLLFKSQKIKNLITNTNIDKKLALELLILNFNY